MADEVADAAVGVVEIELDSDPVVMIPPLFCGWVRYGSQVSTPGIAHQPGKVRRGGHGSHMHHWLRPCCFAKNRHRGQKSSSGARVARSFAFTSVTFCCVGTPSICNVLAASMACSASTDLACRNSKTFEMSH